MATTIYRLVEVEVRRTFYVLDDSDKEQKSSIWYGVWKTV